MKTIEEWKSCLSPLQFRVLREKATEAPFSGTYNDHKETGAYLCAGCSTPLFLSTAKFNSGCGWPAFDRPIDEGVIETQQDLSHGMVRSEILCGVCGGHLGHVFDDGPTDTGVRYCVNSASLDFTKKST